MCDDNLRRKLAALRELARGRGATEAEAMAAAEKMAALLREHALSDEDIEFDEISAPLKGKRISPLGVMAGSIGYCTNCSATLSDGGVIFIGRAPGPEIACYLTAVCGSAIDRALREFKRSPEYLRRRTVSTRRQAGKDFTVGMVDRLTARLMKMFHGSIDKDALTEAKRVRDQRHPGAGPLNLPVHKVRFGGAAQAGGAAASAVQLAHGVNGGRPVHQIGVGAGS